MLGDADGISAGRIHDQHALAGGGVEVDVVDAHAGASDHYQALGVLQQLSRHLRRAAHQQSIGVAYFHGDLALGLREIHDLPRRVRLQNSDDVVGNAVCNEDFHTAF